MPYSLSVNAQNILRSMVSHHVRSADCLEIRKWCHLSVPEINRAIRELEHLRGVKIERNDTARPYEFNKIEIVMLVLRDTLLSPLRARSI